MAANSCRELRPPPTSLWFGNPYQGDVVDQHSWTGNPGAVIGEAVDRLLLATDRLYGWVAFEFGAYRFGLQHRLPPGTPLARIFQPHAQLVITQTEVRFWGR